MFIGVVMNNIVSTYARNNTTCGLLVNAFHGFLSLAFFLNHSDKDLHVWDLFHMRYQVAVPLVQYERIQNLVVSLRPVTVLSLPRKFLFMMSSPRFSTCSAVLMFSRMETGFTLGISIPLGVLDEKSISSPSWSLVANI